MLLATLGALVVSSAAYGKAVVFWDESFPASETEVPARAVLERALPSPEFLTLSQLEAPGALAAGDLLVLPYGSSFPADGWDVIRQHLARGNFLNIGGRPLTVPVWREGTGWRTSAAQTAYSGILNIDHTLELADAGGKAEGLSPQAPRRVFAIAAENDRGRRRGLGFLVNPSGDRVAAPVVADDVGGSRRVFLNFEPQPGYWTTAEGARLLHDSATYAAQGAVRLFIALDSLTIQPGDKVSGTIEVERSANAAGSVRLEVLFGGRTLASLDLACGAFLNAPFEFPAQLEKPGLYEVRAELPEEHYETGLWVHDKQLLESGARLEAGRDYLRLDGKPFLPVGVNYFSTDPYGTSFFLGGSLGGNAWTWDRDFAEMERHGITFVRTGVWQNREHYLDPVTGKASERFLRALEAYLASAARHHMQVEFTFFAFEPQSVEERGPGQDANRLGPGTNPYTDPGAISAQLGWVQSIAARFKDVPFLSFDLINEPSFADPSKLWKGNVPKGDATELAAWREWLAHRYTAPAALAEAWRIPLADLGSFSAVPLPETSDLSLQRSGNSKLARAIDFNLFAQDAFRSWASRIIQAIRDTGARQAITVGQDEGGVTDRVLNQFYGDLGVAFTVNHTWWRDDALLWDSLAAKRPDKPNLIGETGPQPAWALDGSWRWDETNALPLLERKLALGFAAGNAGVADWGWSRDDTFGLVRRDGSFKPWMEVLSGIAQFARAAQPFATEAQRPEIAIVLPQSLQLSVENSWAIEAQQKSVRALYQYARQTAFAVGEYQLALMGDPKLIIVPAPEALRQEAWDTLMSKARQGATLLISGRIDADEHFRSVPSRTASWGTRYSPGLLTTRENSISWPGGSARLSYSGEKTSYLERGILAGGAEYLETTIGSGRLLYFPLPLELAEELDAIGQVYRYAIDKAGIAPVYKTGTTDPGILICPTRLADATLYVLTSESSAAAKVAFEDEASKREIEAALDPGRAALLLVTRDGRIAASYHVR